MVSAHIESIAYYLPEKVLSNEALEQEFPEWSVAKIAGKTGIHTRHIAGDDEFASDLAVAAARKLILESDVSADQIDFVLLCTQSPDFYMPATACLIQAELGIPTNAGALDVNLGCSGYVYGLGLAKGIVESGLAQRVLFVTVDTYSKFVNPRDKSVRTIFGDAATATFIVAGAGKQCLQAFTYGTDGGGAGSLIVPNGGLRPGGEVSPKSSAEERGLNSNGYDLYMDGPAIFNFTLEVVPGTVQQVLARSKLLMEDVDLFVFHQANRFMLEHLRKKIAIPERKFFVSMAECGNTVSSSIPIALSDAVTAGVLCHGMRVMVVGFGVGLSWAGAMITWNDMPQAAL